jgi:translation initiation factor IF-2
LKKRVWELANELGIKSQELLELAQKYGMELRSRLNTLDADQEERLKQWAQPGTAVLVQQEAKTLAIEEIASQTKEVKEAIPTAEKEAIPAKEIVSQKEGGVKVAPIVSQKEAPERNLPIPGEATYTYSDLPKRIVEQKLAESKKAFPQTAISHPFTSPSPLSSTITRIPPPTTHKESYESRTQQKVIPVRDQATALKERIDHKEKYLPRPPRPIEVTVPISVKYLSQVIGVRTHLILQKLIDSKMKASLNQSLDEAMVKMISLEFHKEIKIKKGENQEEMLLKEFEQPDAPEDLVPRGPVVTFMGHVNHGKTSLLDYIRKTDVAAKEAGGITQHIGAYKVEYNNQAIVFLDTPGHEAFTAMRARGAKVTDIVVLVVAADDGVMPQTVEAINHAKAAEVPIIVAINKIDKPTARLDVVMQQLAKHGLLVEEWQGDTISVKVSAITGQGIKELLDYILLVAEMQEVKANPKRKAYGTVLEAKMMEGRGVVATLLVENGTLKTGDIILCGNHYGRVRDIFDHLGHNLKEAGPSTPLEISGISGLPEAGDKFYVLDSIGQARSIAEERQKKLREKSLSASPRKVTAEEIIRQIQEGEIKELRIILKTDVQGSLEAISAKLHEVKNEEIKLRLLHAAVGGVNERDVQLADASHALIMGFDVAANKAARDMAEEKNIEIRRYNVIYQLLEDVKKIMGGMLAPRITEEITGHATIRQVIQVPKIGKIAGCFVTDGNIERSSKIRLYRDSIILNKEKPLEVGSLRRFKEDVTKVKDGFECGIKLAGYEDIKEGDELEAFKIVSVKRTLEQ